MKRFVDGVDRSQGLLLPDRLEDYVHEDNPVRVVDAFVEALDLSELGFEAANRAAGGRPAYHPAALLKIYIYGYLNRIPSSRRLEREAQRNLELIWLTGRLAPDFKTIADFRKDNGGAIDGGVQPLRCAVPDDEGLLACGRRNRRQQAQGGQQPRSQLHGRQGQGSPEAVGRERCALLGRAGSRRPRSQLAARGASPSPEGQAGEAARTDGEAGQHREAA